MPVHFKTVFETIMYEYAKLIADRAIERRESPAPAERNGRSYWSFVAVTFKKLKHGKISASSILRENQQLVRNALNCAYCTSNESLQWEHIVPKSRNGPDAIDNMVLSCASCNREKAAKNPLEWYESTNKHRKEIPRMVMGKLLKVVLEEHRRRNTLFAPEYPDRMGLHLVNLCLVFDHGFDDLHEASRYQKSIAANPINTRTTL